MKGYLVLIEYDHRVQYPLENNCKKTKQTNKQINGTDFTSRYPCFFDLCISIFRFLFHVKAEMLSRD